MEKLSAFLFVCIRDIRDETSDPSMHLKWVTTKIYDTMNPNAPVHQPDVAPADELINAIAERIFSDPDPDAAQIMNKKIKALNEVNRLRHKIKKGESFQGNEYCLPAYPHLSTTPEPHESNVGLGTKINAKQGLRVLDPKTGTPNICTDAYLQLVCDYANLWHSKNSGIDCRSPGTDPKFFHLAQNFHSILMTSSPKEMAVRTRERLSPRQFWKLRYLFVPISFTPAHQNDAHVAVCAISPEAKLVDYICSGGDSGLPDSPRSDGSSCLPQVFAWIAEHVGNEGDVPAFVPSEWRLRTGAGRLQNLWRGDCGIYTVTHVQALAFGYGYGIDVGAFPKDHQHKIIKRRKRYVQDIMFGGFRLYEEGGANLQYYPLIDANPQALESEDFHTLPQTVLSTLPKWCRPRNPCYEKCPNKAALKLHCKRNERLYPGYEKVEVSGRGVSLEAFVRWVEECDERRGEEEKRDWIDPRCASKRKEVLPKHALWVK